MFYQKKLDKKKTIRDNDQKKYTRKCARKNVTSH